MVKMSSCFSCFKRRLKKRTILIEKFDENNRAYLENGTVKVGKTYLT